MSDERKKWTDEDNEMFKKLYPSMTYRQLATYFSITEKAAQKRAQYLGCRKSKDRVFTPALVNNGHGMPLGPLELAYGHVAVDQKSYDTLKRFGVA